MVCKIRRAKKCADGDHTFAISEWRIGNSGTVQKANSWTCIHCLHSVEGDYSVKQIRAELHAVQDSKTATDGADTKDT